MLEYLPHINASLNSTAALLLFLGWVAIKKRKEKLHANLMCFAFLASAAFLVCYLTFHIFGTAKTYAGPENLKHPYFGMLISHIILAVVMVPMILRTFLLAFKKRLKEHIKLGKITLAIWFYVSVTGVLIYLILYQSILG